MKETSKLSTEQMKKIGRNINSAIAKADVKQKDIAKELDVEDNRISKFCAGVLQPNLAQLIKISKMLNVSTDYLLGLSKNPTANMEEDAMCNYIGCSLETLHAIMDAYDCFAGENEYLNLFEQYNSLDEYFEENIYFIVQQDCENIITNYFLESLFIGTGNMFTLTSAILSRCYANTISEYIDKHKNNEATESKTNVLCGQHNFSIYDELEIAEDFADLMEYKSIRIMGDVIRRSSELLRNKYVFSDKGIFDKNGKQILSNVFAEMWRGKLYNEEDGSTEAFTTDTYNTFIDSDLPYLNSIKKHLSYKNKGEENNAEETDTEA